MDEKKVVLVVDDNLDHRTIAAALLTYAGYTAVQAESVAQAVRLISTVNPDLLIVDIDMPEKNGLAWVVELRAEAATADLPIILYSAYRDVYTAELRQLGIACVDKAEPPNRFLDRVGMALGEEQQ